jgi:site-specific DNA-cytosine methylase
VLELEQQGYDCLPIPLSAFDVGAPHLRKRLFIVAHADRDRQPARAEHAEVVGASVAERPSANTHGQLGDTGASNARKKRTRRSVAAGGAPTDVDGVRPVEQRRREPGTPATIAAGDCAAAADVDGSGREGDRAEALTGRSRLAEDPWGPPVPELLRMADGFSARLDRSRPRIAALGDSVVPQCAEVVGWVIRELIGETR